MTAGPTTTAVAPPVPPTLAPADRPFADRLRDALAQGRWGELAQLVAPEPAGKRPTAQHALLRAMATQAMGDPAAMRRVAADALAAGCGRAALARAMLSVVHNTLGRASAAAGVRGRDALHHFEQSIALGAPAHADLATVRARVQAQLVDLGLGDDLPRLADDAVPPAEGRSVGRRAPRLREMAESLHREQLRLRAQLDLLTDRMTARHASLDHTVRDEVRNGVKQVEAFANLLHFLSGGVPVPSLHGWPVSADFALLMVRLIDAGDFDAVVEFGSGTSTVLIAHALGRVANRRPSGVPGLQTTLEHDPGYAAKTGQLLSEAGVRTPVDLRVTPLQPLAMKAGDVRSYYDCHDALQELAGRLQERLAGSGRPPRLLLVVDGPPGVTGPLARYGALEVVHRAIGGFDGQILLDDYGRPDERAVARRWREYLHAHGFTHTLEEFDLEKSACVLTVRAPAPTGAAGAR